MWPHASLGLTSRGAIEFKNEAPLGGSLHWREGHRKGEQLASRKW